MGKQSFRQINSARELLDLAHPGYREIISFFFNVFPRNLNPQKYTQSVHISDLKVITENLVFPHGNYCDALF